MNDHTTSSTSGSSARPTLPEVMDAVADIEGWMTPGQASTLYDAATRCPADGRIVEIGSFQGRSTVVLASAADPSVEVIAIDPHAGNDRGPQEIDGFADEAESDHGRFISNLTDAGVVDRVTHVRKFSDDAHADVSGGVDVLYVDGAHRYAPALADISSWGKRVNDGGTLLIHDSFSSIGVTLAILKHLVFGKRFRYVGRSRSMTIYRADLGGSPLARLTNTAKQLAQLPWFVKNLGLKVLLTLGLGKAMRRLGRDAPEWPY